jgi:anti-sigma B factor antagonist
MVLTVTLDKIDGAIVVAASGELDLGTAPVIRERLAEAETLHPPLLVLDLSGLDFMDSTGLRIILAADANARRDDRRFVVVRGPDPVHRVFLIARLDDRLELVDDVPTALARGDTGR